MADDIPSESQESSDSLTESAPTDADLKAQKRRALKRVGLLAVVIVALYVIAVATGLDEQLTTDNIRSMMQDAGPWGIVVFVVVFIVGNLIQIPSNVFLLAAIYSFGFLDGVVLSYFSNVISICVSFFLVRSLGGQPLSLVQKPWMRKALDQLDQRPIRAIFAMRAIMGGSPPLNYTLAMSEVRFRDYLIGSGLGLIPPIVVVAALMAKAIE